MWLRWGITEHMTKVEVDLASDCKWQRSLRTVMEMMYCCLLTPCNSCDMFDENTELKTFFSFYRVLYYIVLFWWVKMVDKEKEKEVFNVVRRRMTLVKSWIYGEWDRNLRRRRRTTLLFFSFLLFLLFLICWRWERFMVVIEACMVERINFHEFVYYSLHHFCTLFQMRVRARMCSWERWITCCKRLCFEV